jgi:hypothetical protein
MKILKATKPIFVHKSTSTHANAKTVVKRTLSSKQGGRKQTTK